MGGPGKTSPSGGSYGCEGRRRTGSLLFGQASDGPAPASKLFPLLTGEPHHVSRVRGGRSMQDCSGPHQRATLMQNNGKT